MCGPAIVRMGAVTPPPIHRNVYSASLLAICLNISKQEDGIYFIVYFGIILRKIYSPNPILCMHTELFMLRAW